MRAGMAEFSPSKYHEAEGSGVGGSSDEECERMTAAEVLEKLEEVSYRDEKRGCGNCE